MRILFFAWILLLLPVAVHAQPETDEECMTCHEDRTLVAAVDGKKVNAFIDYPSYVKSIHGKEGCVSCHVDVDPEDLPHEDDLDRVECFVCHDVAAEKFERSLHGQAVERGRLLAPTCLTCHGKHDILSSEDENARTFVMNIPSLCGSCHKDGTTVSELRTMSPSQRHVLEDYTESIHGAGLLEQGLIVTAVCTSCHTSHDVLPHEHAESSIHRENITRTCMQCHRQVEKVHVKVVNGELWEKRPHEVPVCVDCHQSHVFQQVKYQPGFPDDYCLTCHGELDLHKVTEGETISLHIDRQEIEHSAHREIQCVKCHVDVSRTKNPVCIDSQPVDCSGCHEQQGAEHELSSHALIDSSANEDLPGCISCHGDHGILANEHPDSPTYPRNVPDLCGRCHDERQNPELAAERGGGHIVENYAMSIHGKDLLEGGLIVTATCVDCHTAHRPLPADDSASSVNPDIVSSTCAACHIGVFEKFQRSVHSPLVTQTDEDLPVCNDCHESHSITRTDEQGFKESILKQCGDCHEEVTETYFETFHGKVTKLGSMDVARCNDCHGAHDILPASEADSRLSDEHIVETCRQCHPAANARFATYLTHAEHSDREAYPYLFYSFWAMTGLLVSVFAFFGVHTVLWFPRELAEKRKQKKNRDLDPDEQNEDQ